MDSGGQTRIWINQPSEISTTTKQLKMFEWQIQWVTVYIRFKIKFRSLIIAHSIDLSVQQKWHMFSYTAAGWGMPVICFICTYSFSQYAYGIWTRESKSRVNAGRPKSLDKLVLDKLHFNKCCQFLLHNNKEWRICLFVRFRWLWKLFLTFRCIFLFQIF